MAAEPVSSIGALAIYKELTMILIIPDELKDEFNTFLEVGLAYVTHYLDELTPNEQRLVKILQRVDEWEYNREELTALLSKQAMDESCSAETKAA